MSILRRIFFLAIFIVLSACGTNTTNTTLVRSTPINASVFIDGKLAGVTPLELHHLIKETHKIRLEKEGYVPVDDYLSVEHSHAIISTPDYWVGDDRYAFKPEYYFNLQPVEGSFQATNPKKPIK